MIWARYSSSAATIWTGPFETSLIVTSGQSALSRSTSCLMIRSSSTGRTPPKSPPRSMRAMATRFSIIRWSRSASAATLTRSSLRVSGIEPRAAPEQQLRAAVDRGDRRAELVRQDAEEAVADLVRLVAPRDVRDDRDLERPAVELERAARDLGREVGAVDAPAGRLGAEDGPIAGCRRSSRPCAAPRGPPAACRSGDRPSQPNSSPAWRVAQVTRLSSSSARIAFGSASRRARKRASLARTMRDSSASRRASPRPMSISSRSMACAVSEREVGDQREVVADEQRPALDVGDQALGHVAAPGRTVELDRGDRPASAFRGDRRSGCSSPTTASGAPGRRAGSRRGWRRGCPAPSAARSVQSAPGRRARSAARRGCARAGTTRRG